MKEMPPSAAGDSGRDALVTASIAPAFSRRLFITASRLYVSAFCRGGYSLNVSGLANVGLGGDEQIDPVE